MFFFYFDDLDKIRVAEYFRYDLSVRIKRIR